MDGILPSYLAALGLILSVPKFFSDKFSRENIVDVAKVNRQRCCLEQWTAEI